MCRPIESRDSLGAMGPAAVALFAGYQPSAAVAATNNKAMLSQNVKASGRAPAWSTAGDLGFGADGMNMLSMAAPPPALPFVSFPKPNSLPAMPWAAAAPSTDLLSLGLPSDQFAAAETKPEAVQPNFEAQELEELLDFSMPGEMESVSKDKPDLVNLDDGFDGTEMSILYSFLVDAPEDKAKQTAEIDDGILNLNVLAGSPIDGLMESFESDFTDSELMMTPRQPEPHMVGPKTLKPGEVKSRRLCESAQQGMVVGAPFERCFGSEALAVRMLLAVRQLFFIYSEEMLE
ncbi:hypothetical protein PRIC2_012861 [Phytophthora ramorum]|uniref:uncharacterized protein n=1 Tax=Phytophthora ramorum TaxID=164328 RepID=UPI0030B169D3|nr:hypothetical protein KRP23_8847 [Phytophthora ramorum]